MLRLEHQNVSMCYTYDMCKQYKPWLISFCEGSL